MQLSSLFAEGRFVVSGEVGPPKGVSAEKVLEGAAVMAPVVDVVNVTDNQSAVVRLGSLAVAHLLKQRGIEPVYQLTCRDRNRIALQSDLLSAAALGVENVLILTGDHTVLGDHPGARNVFDLDSVQLLAAAKGLNEGHDLADHELDDAPNLCLGAVVNPGSDEPETQLIKMKKKVDAGAQFFQTQAVYEPDLFARFMDKASPVGVPVMVGIVPLKSAGMARYMTENVAGVRVPDEMTQRMADAKKADRRKVSAELAAGLIRRMKDLCQGVHLMPLGWDDIVPEIVTAAGVR
jgi:methylenetetrahydrofolate reductase (NADPH)